ncbi:MAG TPA: hypothetical protein VK822_03710 [Acetobacteraceae bacterium]|jgi:hypothetical protein|nr:hypothetical protein [Acetobacteraceae bacterium]HTB47901.1 hypothetical protein [Acetobacteraceae bacterium]
MSGVSADITLRLQERAIQFRQNFEKTPAPAYGTGLFSVVDGISSRAAPSSWLTQQAH